jgi:hypothetical protein
MDKPRMARTIGLIWAIRAIWAIGFGFVSLQNLPSGRSALQSDLVSSAQTIFYVIIAVNVLSLVAVVLTLNYRRLGLMLGGVITVLDLLGLGWLLSRSAAPLLNILMLVLDLIILYYIVRFMTREPEKLAFK